ncbi:MAG: SH3 domain-containing protein [Bacteroidales bacterium]
MRSGVFAISIFIVFQIFSPESFSQDAKTMKFNQGVDLFSAGSFDKALEQWLDLYNTGYRSAELEYNIGNAYFKLKNIPGAILFYERAHLLKPADEDINYNLQIARTLIVDRFDEIPELFFVRWYGFLALTMSTNSWARISITAFLLCLIFLSLYFYSSKYRLKVLGFWLALLLIIVSLSALAFSARNRQLVHNSHKAIIFSPQISGKSSPDNSGTDLFVLHEGTKVTTGEKVGDWYEIRLSDGNKGWIPAGSIQII